MGEQLNIIGELQRVQLRDGDTLVITTDQHLPADAAARLRNLVYTTINPETNVLVLDGGLKVGVVGRAIDDGNAVERWAAEEYREGVSPGAAARQLCRSLGANGAAPTLQRLLEDMLSDANRASFDRSQILSDFAEADPEAAAAAQAASFARIDA